MEYLTEIISDYEMNDYYEMLITYKLNRDISIMPDGTLFFPIDYKGIKEDFNLTITEPNYVFDTKVFDLKVGQGYVYDMYKKKDRIFSNAMTYKGKVRYSFI